MTDLRCHRDPTDSRRKLAQRLGREGLCVIAALGVASCKEAPPPPPNEPPAASSSDPDEIVLLEQQRARAASSARSATSAEGPSAGPEVSALLDGLKRGDKLGPVEVVSISPVTHGTVVVELGRSAERGTIFFVKLGDGPPPPASSQKYAVYYRSEKTPNPISVEALQAACTALADRLRKTELSAPAPAGLTGFSPEKPAPSSGKKLAPSP